VSEHTCHATACNTPVPEKLFMCPRHWRMLPKAMQREVWSAYVAGQEVRKDPTRAYLEVTRRCIRFVATKEGLRAATPDHDLFGADL
jgi:hypothetical protein